VWYTIQMEESYDHIYAISNTNESGCLKIGKTTKSNPLERIRQFKTGVSVPWKVEMLIRVPSSKIDYIDNQIKKMLELYNVKKGGGTEFFNLVPDSLSVFKTTFLFYNTDCTEVGQVEIAEMENKLNTTRGKPIKRGNNDGLPRGYSKAYELSRKTKRIYFVKNLDIEPFAGRNGILETTPLDINDAKSVKIWLNEVQYITEHYKNKYYNGQGNSISDVTLGNGSLKAFLRRHI
jgi:hypothetical protein